jgi:hypothetical protein
MKKNRRTEGRKGKKKVERWNIWEGGKEGEKETSFVILS